MARSSRAKTTACTFPVPQSRDEAASALKRMGDLSRDLGRLEADMNDQISALKERYEQAAGPILFARDVELEGLRVWAEANRAALTGGDKTKTVDLGTGLIRWRTRPPSVTLQRGIKIEEALRRLRAMKRFSFIRTRAELDREAILAAHALPPDLRSANDLIDLTHAGIKVGSAGEDFVAEPAELELSEGAP
jgi:phage host-nuclease inhibitor protein Gam